MTTQFLTPQSHPTGSLRKLTMALLCVGALSRCGFGNPAANSDDPGESVQQLGSPEARTLKSLDLTPDNPIIQVDLNKQATRTFKLIAKYDDRSTVDVTALATFSVDNPAVGVMFGPRFDSNIRTTAEVSFAKLTAKYKEGAIEQTISTNLTVVWMRTSGSSKDFFLKLPYRGAASSATLSASTSIQSLDAFFAVDTTGSMYSEINALRASMDSTIVPAVRAAAVKDAWVGVGAIEDFGVDGYGSPGCYGGLDDQPFIMLSPMTNDSSILKVALDGLLHGMSPRGCGADTPEGQMEALYQIATGAGNVVSGVVNIPAHHDKGRGGVEFRAGSLPVITLISDASFHTKSEASGRTCYGEDLDYSGSAEAAAHTRSETTAALKNICARVVGVSIPWTSEEGCLATQDLLQMATDTGALVPPQVWDALGRPTSCAAGDCCTGLSGAGEKPNADGLCPLVFKSDSSGAGIGTQVAAGITQLVRYAAFDANVGKAGDTADEDGNPLPAGKTTADFVTSISAVDATVPTVPPGLKPPVAVGDHFTGVTPASTLRFTLNAKNDFAPASAKPQVFKLKLVVQASGCADLDTRDVLILVPAA